MPQVGRPGAPSPANQLSPTDEGTTTGPGILVGSPAPLPCNEARPTAPTGKPFTVRYVRRAYNKFVAMKSDLRRRKDMTILKSAKRLWTLLTTEEVLREDGVSERRAMVRRSSRV